jgi:hypothetical protein
MELFEFLQSVLTAGVNVRGEIVQVHALLALLRCLGPHHRNGDLAGGHLSQKLVWREVAKIISANILNGDYRLAAILCEKQKRCG